ncbi:hyalin domain-containing protein [Flammeovirgaceae bacterium 311]|nr:hyalin domain-containing protein [Flammeovirgaceae bacterium 311]
MALSLFIIAAAPALLPAFSTHAFNVDENKTAGEFVGQILPKTDSEGDALHFELVGGNTSNAFSLSEDGALSVLNTAALDFETTPSFRLTVRVTAGRGTETEAATDVKVDIDLNDVAEAASVQTGAAAALSEKGATISGIARSNGSATTVAFQLGTDSSLPAADPSSLAGAQTLAAGAPAAALSHGVNNLLANTTYYYRLVGKNSTGIFYGETASFTTHSIPEVLSIKRNSPSPSNKKNVSFRVKFSEAVSGVDADDFTLVKGAGVSAAIVSVTEVAAGEYDVNLGSINGNGSLKLNFKDNKSVKNSNSVTVGGSVAGAGDFSNGETYQLDFTAPVISIAGPTSEFTQIGPVTYIITYSESSNITLSPADITLIHESSSVDGSPSTAEGTVIVTGTSNTQRIVSIENISGNGVLRISVAAGTATDEAGNEAAAAGPSHYVVVDNIAPVGYCPGDIVFENSTSNCEAYVTIPYPTFTDNTDNKWGGVVYITNDRTGTANPSGTFPAGTTAVTWEFKDRSGNWSKCTTNVLVKDVAPPVVSCPSDIIQSASATACSAVVTYSIPFSDNCSGATIVQTAGLPSGASYPLGETLNKFTITDAKGNATECSFKVTVVDDKGPVIACPADIIVDIEPGKNGATVTYAAITAQDNCSGSVTPLLKSGLASGSFFPSGTTNVVYEAVDAAGNVSVCSFAVTVVDDEAPIIVISAPSVPITQNGPVTYTVTYYGATNINLTPADIILNKTETATATTVTVTPTDKANELLVTISDISGNGTIGISIKPGTATDLVNNPAPGAGPSETFIVDNLAPSIAIGSSSVHTLEDVPTAPITITISDAGTPATELQVRVSADDAALAPEASFSITGSGQNRSLVITPALHRHGSTVITVKVKDNLGQESSKQFTLTVEAVADKPLVTTEDAFGPEDTWIGLEFSAALVDTDGSETITHYLVESVPVGARLSAGTDLGNGLWQLTPAQLASLSILPPLDFVGKFPLGIRATSKEGSNGSQAESETEELIVTVLPVNDGPSFSLSQTAIVRPEDFPEDVIINIVDLKDSDNQLTDVTFSLSPASVSWVNISINAATGEIVLKSVKDQNQPTPFTFTVRANDGSAENNITEQTFTVQIVPVNDAPVISIVSPWVMQEDFAGNETRPVTVATPPADEVNETITYEITPDPASLGFINLQFSNGTFSATSVTDAIGEAPLTIRAFDGTAYSEPIELLVRVVPVNDAPAFEILAEDIRLKEDFGDTTIAVVTLAIHNNWEADEAYTYSLSPLTHEKITIRSFDAATGEVTFESVQDANAPEGIEFTITATDGDLTSSQTFMVYIEPVNDAPHGDLEEIVFEVEIAGVHELHPAVYTDVDLNDTPTNEEITITLEGAPAWLSLVVTTDDNGNRIIRAIGTAPLGEEGNEYPVTATITDAEGLVHMDDFIVKVICNNALPTVAEDEVTLTFYMNQQPDPSEPHYEFTVTDDAKAAIEGAEVLQLTLVEVDASMISKVELVRGQDNEWRLWVTPADNQYGETTFKIQINDLAYCNTDQNPREPVFITVHVVIKLRDMLDIPTLITPNGDGDNDTWNIFGLEEFQKHQVRVFDNRGRVIFTSNTYGPGKEWDGTLNGTPLPDGTYTFQIMFNEGKDKRQGHITIAR